MDGTVAFVLGTRPEIVKLAPLAARFGDLARVVHTGQHYDEHMSDVFFAECGLRSPDAYLNVGGCSRAAQVGLALHQLDNLFAEQRPAAVVVQGDTNSGVAGALAANAREIPLIHIEAGLRSFDRRMPEEHNRVVIDHLADVLCAATPGNRANLAAEGIDAQRIAVTGNTIVEAVQQHLPPAEQRAKLLADHGLSSAGFVLATLHRPENTDDPASLAAILSELDRLPALGWPVVLPMHPRTLAALDRFGCRVLTDRIAIIEPVGYRSFLSLAAEAALIVSDSGGLQEECTVLKRPMVVVRRSTERPESLLDFATLVPPGPALGIAVTAALSDVPTLHKRLLGCPSPYGDGTASSQIHRLIIEGA